MCANTTTASNGPSRRAVSTQGSCNGEFEKGIESAVAVAHRAFFYFGVAAVNRAWRVTDKVVRKKRLDFARFIVERTKAQHNHIRLVAEHAAQTEEHAQYKREQQ